MTSLDLPTIWAALIAFAVLAYIVLDGFDLGVGMLFPLFPARADRDRMMNAVAPVWDGNETWLVLGGGGLMAAFPLAYATVLPALYMPIVLMLLGLVFRGVAFEFRWRTERARWVWDWSFALGSLVAALSQGIVLGALVQGIAIDNRAYAGGWWDWLTPFSLLTGVAVAIGYVLLGATWLNLKTDGALQTGIRKLAGPVALAVVALMGVVSLWTPFLRAIYFERWFTAPSLFFSAIVPAIVLLLLWTLWTALRNGKDLVAYLAANALFLVAYIGIGISFYPYIVPGALTIAEAAAPDASLSFLLVGTLIMIPVILAYTGYAYWVFRGKLQAGDGYH